MDWLTFIKDNSQALFTLGGVLLGSMVTFLGNFLNNRFQAKENDKERLGKRQEAKDHLAIELMKNDMRVIENVIMLMFGFINTIKDFKTSRQVSTLTEEQWKIEFSSFLDKDESILKKISEADTITDVLLYIHGGEFYSAYTNCKDLFSKYLSVLTTPSTTEQDEGILYEELVAVTGKLQRMLRKKLISMSDFEQMT